MNVKLEITIIRYIFIDTSTFFARRIISNSIAKNGGNATYRGKVEIKKNATNSESFVKCDSLILDNISKSDTYPININQNDSSNIIHEATVSKISEDNLMYLMTRGITKEKAT